MPVLLAAFELSILVASQYVWISAILLLASSGRPGCTVCNFIVNGLEEVHTPQRQARGAKCHLQAVDQCLGLHPQG